MVLYADNAVKVPLTSLVTSRCLIIGKFTELSGSDIMALISLAAVISAFTAKSTVNGPAICYPK